MGDEMGTFRVTVEIENPVRSGERRTLESVLVDTGPESRSLAGLNLRFDPVSKRLVDAGPAPAAVATGAAGECVGAIRSPDSASGWGWH